MQKFVQFNGDSFRRRYGDFLFVTNQRAGNDVLLNKESSLFVDIFYRTPSSTQEIIEAVATQYPSVPTSVVEQDLSSLLDTLMRGNYIVQAETLAELALRAKAYLDVPSNKRKHHDSGPATPAKSVQELLSAQFAGHPELYRLQIEVTSACNEKCLHCYMPPGRHRRFLDFDLARNIVDQGVKMGTLVLAITGGECLSHPQVLELIQYARKRDLMVSVLSNLTLLEERHIEVFRSSRIAHVQVSLYSIEDRVHDAITRLPGSCERTKKAIDKLLLAGIPVVISCPLMKHNRSSYFNVARWGKERSCSVNTDIVLIGRYDQSTDNLESRLSLEETRSFLDTYYSRNKSPLPSTFNSEGVKQVTSPNAQYCPIGNDSLCVSADGQYFACPGFQHYPLGDAANAPLNQVWLESERLAALRKITMKDFPACQLCDSADYCSRCLARNFTEGKGDLQFMPSHVCEVAKLNRECVSHQ